MSEDVQQEISASKGRKAALRAAMALIAFTILMALMFLASPGARYDWIKAFHVIAVISWMAGMLYLPRLFVYHVDAEPGSAQDKTFITMERRLLKVIMAPAMMLAWLLGLWLAWTAGFFTQIWFLAKLVAVLVMTGAHIYLSRAAKAFADGCNTKSARHWRLINEVPTVAMVAAVIFVIVKPF